MWYKIIETKTSDNDQVFYSLFKRLKSLEELTAYTYGIIAADRKESYTIDDILTDRDEVETLLDNLCRESVNPKDFLPFVIQYLDTV